MADLTELQSAPVTKIAGANATTGSEDYFVDADGNGNLKVIDYATSAIGSAVPSNASFLGAKNPSGNLAGLISDSSSNLYVNLATPIPAGTNAIGNVRLLDGAGNTITSLGGNLNVTTNFRPGTADLFGNLAVSSHHNQIQIDFNYMANGSMISAYGNLTTTGSGSNSLNTNGSASFSTGTSGTGFSSIQSPTTVIYQEGAEVYCSNSVCFTTPTSANSYQRSGIYDANNGYFVGFNGLNFGITSRKSGVDTFVAQANFNQDTLTGAPNSTFTRNNIPEALDQTKINLYRIRYGWYGVSPCYFDTFSADGQWVTFHKILYPNTFTIPSTQTPNNPVTLEVSTSGADATNLTMSAGALTAGVLDIKVPDTIVQPLNLNALNAQISVVMAGLQSAGFQINAGTFIGTLTPQASMDGGATWINTDFYDPNSALAFPTLTFSSANTSKTLGILSFPGASNIRVIVTSYTSGSAVGLIRAVAASANLISLGGSYNPTPPTLGTGESTQLQTDVNGRLLTSSVSLPTTASKFRYGAVTTSSLAQVPVEATAYTQVTTASAMTLVSSSANDTSVGTGARTVRVTYLDDTGAGPFTTDFSLNGTIAVNSGVSNMCYIEKITVLTAGTGGSNAGILTLKQGSKTIGSIAAGLNDTQWAHHYVPTGKTSYISGFSIGNSASSVGAGSTVILKAITLVAGSAELQVSDYINVAGGSNTIVRQYNSPIQIVGPARIRAYVNPLATSTYTTYASFDFIDN